MPSLRQKLKKKSLIPTPFPVRIKRENKEPSIDLPSMLKEMFEARMEIIENKFQKEKEETLQELLSLVPKLKEKAEKDVSEHIRSRSVEIRGKDGYTPVKGKDYFDGKNADESVIVKKVLDILPPFEVTSEKEIREIAYQEVGRFLSSQKNPTEKDIKKIAQSVQKIFRPEENAEAIARSLETLEGEKRFDYNALKNKPTIPTGAQYGGKTLHRGGGVGGILEVVSGDIDDSNTIFVFLQPPKRVVVNGISYRNGAGVTITGTTAELDNPAGSGGDVYGLA